VTRASCWFYNDERDQVLCADLFEMGRGHSNGVTWITPITGLFFCLAIRDHDAADDAHAHPATREFSQGYLIHWD